MADSIFTKMVGPEIEGAAVIFARKFKEAGVFTAGSEGSSGTNNKMTKEQRQQNKSDKIIAKAQKVYASNQKEAAKGDKKAITAQRVAMNTIKNQQKVTGSAFFETNKTVHSFGEAVKKSGNDIKAATKDIAASIVGSALSFRTGKFLAAKAAYQGFNDFKAAMKYGTDVTEGVWSNMSNAMSLGIDPSRLSEIQASTRQAVSVMGGAEQWSKKVSSVQSSMFGHIGDLDTTTQFMADSMSTLIRAGIQPTTDAFMSASGELGPLGKTFKDIQKISGATFAETGQLMKELAEDSTIRWKLMGAASSKQRRVIIQETMERHKNLLAMGMNTEQAKRASAALDQMAGKGPKERLKQAAKMQMMMGAMGVAGGGRAAELMRKRVRTGQEDKELAGIMATVNTKVAETQQRSLSGDFFASAMIQKTGMEGLMGPGSPFEKNLTDMAAKGTITALSTKTMAEEYPKTTVLVGNIQKIISNFAVNPLLTGILAGVSFIGATVLQIRMGMGMGMGGGLTDLVSGKRGGKLGMLKGIAKGVGKFALGLGIAGGILQTFSETTAQTAKNANNLGDVLGGQVTNNIVSGLRNIGDILSLNFAGDLGEWIGKTYANVINDVVPSLEKWGAGFAATENQRHKTNMAARKSQRHKTNMAAAESQKNKTNMAATESQKNKTNLGPNFSEVQAKLDAANVKLDDPQLRDIAALLMELKITNEQANKFSNKQIETLAKIAEDGEVSKDEAVLANKTLRNTRRRSSRSSAV